MPWWPFDTMTLMWIQITTGFTGALTLVYVWRWLGRALGRVLHIGVHFSPRGGCQEAVAQEVANARWEILVQAYSFTSKAICDALVEAKKRGVRVVILLDKSNEVERYSDLHLFIEQGLDPLIDAEHAIAHNKVMIIDQKTIVTGSFNFTHQAEGENAENLLIIKGHPDLARQYHVNFMKHKDHCRQVQVKEPKEFREAPKEVKTDIRKAA
jgi:phosphatidylserine/phosphatidylglycerophosphate/cardiolipin synthase-like enzyme